MATVKNAVLRKVFAKDTAGLKKKKKLIETYMETLKTGLRLCYAKLVLRTTESASPSAC